MPDLNKATPPSTAKVSSNRYAVRFSIIGLAMLLSLILMFLISNVLPKGVRDYIENNSRMFVPILGFLILGSVLSFIASFYFGIKSLFEHHKDGKKVIGLILAILGIGLLVWIVWVLKGLGNIK